MLLRWTLYMRLCAVAGLCLLGDVALAQVTWQLDNLSSIGGHTTTVIGDPTVVSTPFGDGIRFDGNDGVIVDANPIAGASQFTMEMLFLPDPIVNPGSNEPRIFHVQSDPAPPDHRAILEGRVTADNQNWYLDTFLLSQSASSPNPSVTQSLALIDPSKTHPLGQWYGYAMVYDGAEVRAYVNGQLDLSGALAVLGTADGHTSLGMRINVRKFFEGVIAQVRFSTSALAPEHLLVPSIPGDYDGDGRVNAADYVVYRNNAGQVVTLPNGLSNPTTPQIDQEDYDFWVANFGNPAGDGNNQSVPEPATWLAAAICTLLIAGRRCSLRRIR